jgi:MFS transporter, PPP family, 3-phenylpropionic acid transporter
MRASVRASPLPRFILLYTLLYAGFGVASPFLPAFFERRGLGAEQVSIVLATGTAIRLLSGPAVNRLADALTALRLMLAVSMIGAAAASLGYLAVETFWLIVAVSLLHSMMLAPTTTIADALTLGAAMPEQGRRIAFEYGWVRGAGSAAFIVATILSGQAIAVYGLLAIVWLSAALLCAGAAVTWLVPERVARNDVDPQPVRGEGGVRQLVRSPTVRRVTLIAALVLGSHALHDSFSMIRWLSAGIGPGPAGLLWAEAVMAEVVVFFLLGPWLLARLGPAGALALAAGAGALRWIVMALSVDEIAIALTQPLHGLTFALLHLACMRLLAAAVPPDLAATAQAIYGTVGVGGANVLVTLAAGALYARYGAAAFWPMAALCLLALPLALQLRRALPDDR